jgi:hypothetical protein
MKTTESTINSVGLNARCVCFISIKFERSMFAVNNQSNTKSWRPKRVAMAIRFVISKICVNRA